MTVKELLNRALAATADDPNRALIGSRGFPLARGQIERYRVTEQAGNLIAQAGDTELRVDIGRQGTGNLIVVGAIERGQQRLIHIAGSNNTVIVGDTRKFSPRVTIIGDGNLLYSGEAATMNEVGVVLKGHGRSVIVGRDCMFSMGISVRASDSHGIYDIATNTLLNAPESILFHPHVWVSEGATVLKGVTIGTGSVIGAGSLVTMSVPPRALVVGTPAKVIREGVSWTRNEGPGEREMQQMTRWLENVERERD